MGGRFPLEGKKAQGRAIATNIDVATLMEGLHDTRLLEPGDVDYAGGQAGRQHWMGGAIELAVFGAAGTWNLVNIPGEAVVGAYNRIRRAKEDAVADIEHYKA